MISPVILGVASVALFLQSVTTPATGGELSAGQKEVLFRVCKSVSPEQLERCKARQMRTLTVNDSKSSPTDAYETYTGIDLGRGKLRQRLQTERQKEAALRARARKTFAEDPLQESSSLQPRSYVDFIREERLKCMLAPSGRSRSLCLDALGNSARDLMRDARRSSQNFQQ